MHHWVLLRQLLAVLAIAATAVVMTVVGYSSYAPSTPCAPPTTAVVKVWLVYRCVSLCEVLNSPYRCLWVSIDWSPRLAFLGLFLSRAPFTNPRVEWAAYIDVHV
jgi:hypothetical protein